MNPGVLLISPGVKTGRGADFGVPHLVSMGGLLRRELGVRVQILDLAHEAGGVRTLGRTVQEHGPYLLAGISCYSSFDYLRVMGLGRLLRRLYPDLPLVSGGYHTSAMPDDLVFDGSPFDAAVVGEGELPLLRMTETVLGGGRPEPLYGPEPVAKLDDLPPYQWELLDRYWPRAHALGAKLQIYLSRGCPHRCSFCMERAKGSRTWRAFSVERALDELQRLDHTADLSKWLVNLTDPMFGNRPSWRREVLQGIGTRGLMPRQYWTLTRAEGLERLDVELLAKARVSVGVGLESGSPEMLRLMNKTNAPERYLDAIRHLAERAGEYGLTWAANIIVGHPGETRATMEQTHRFVAELFSGSGGRQPRGWLSVDPFRVYPGSKVFAEMQSLSQRHGTRFHHPRWWRRGGEAAICSELVDPSRELDYPQRVRFMHDNYAPLVASIAKRFKGQSREVDTVFRSSMKAQAEVLGAKVRDRELESWRRLRGGSDTDGEARITLSRPLHAQLLYHVLSHLDLGEDAASLLRPGLPARPWVRGLLEAYLAAPNRLAVQVLALFTDDLEQMNRWLTADAEFPGAGDEDRRLAGRLAAALDVEQKRVTEAEQAFQPNNAGLLKTITPVLSPLRKALWKEAGKSPPELSILDCPALATPNGTHGRATPRTDGNLLVVAVALAAPTEQLLCQLLHEEIHAVTDPETDHDPGHPGQDTRLHSPGAQRHHQLELRAARRGRELIRDHAPDMQASYATWMRRHGMRP